MNMQLRNAAAQLRHAVEMNADGASVGECVQQLVQELGGTRDSRELSPGTAAVYLLALVLSQPPQ